MLYNTAVEERTPPPAAPAVLPPARPTLVILLPDLVKQWAREVRNFSSRFRPMIYHGDKRPKKSSSFERIDGVLSRHDTIFNGDEKNRNIIVLTSLATLVHRHGPNALIGYRTSTKGYSKAAATDIKYVMEDDWVHNLANCFDIVIIDEAHVIKNPETMSHTAVTWLNAKFTLLVTASVLPNSIRDFDGYIKFIENNNNLWDPTSLQAMGVDKNVNPYTLPDTHPAVCLRLTAHAVTKFITDRANTKDKDKDKAGYVLSKVWAQCMIRRTYQSPDPQNPDCKVCDSIAPLFSRRIAAAFTNEEAKWYASVSFESERRLVTKLEDGTITWNRKHARQLVLNSTWIGFSYIGDDIHANTVQYWKQQSNLLYSWVGLHRTRMVEKNQPINWAMPETDDTLGLLLILCRGAPKLRVTLRLISEIVILGARKVTIWCALPASQLLIYACLQALQIKTVCYTSDLTTTERSELVDRFCRSADTRVFIGSYFVGSTGLNLQAMCNHTVEFDSPPTSGARTQARGRVRRIGQRYNVENFELSVPNSFQNRVISTMIRKSLPGLIAELRINITQQPDNNDMGDKALSIGHWYLVGNELIQGPDPRVDALPNSERLDATQLVIAITDIQSGKIYEIESGWEEEEVDDSLLPDEYLELPMEIKRH
jgi:SNF2 family DNA or RNA helicase